MAYLFIYLFTFLSKFYLISNFFLEWEDPVFENYEYLRVGLWD